MSLELLKSSTNRLLTSDNQDVIHIALDAIHHIFSEISTVRGDILEEHHGEQTFLDGGIAISPHLAARCLLDPVRTVQFLRGIHAGIHEAFCRFPDEQIQVVYAGCGPYATLLLPLTTQFTPDQIQLTLIDLHKPSIEGVRRIVETLGLDDYVYQCVQTNAITYEHPPDIPLHMVVSETMQTGLAGEPQVAIMRNFLPQLKKNGIFIPENIMVEACLSSSKEEDIGLLMMRDKYGYPAGRAQQMHIERQSLGRIMALNAESAHPDVIGQAWDPIPLTTIHVPPQDEHFDQLLLVTAVSVYGPYGFEPYDCELSFPLKIKDLTHIAGGAKIRFSYIFGNDPGLQHQLI